MGRSNLTRRLCLGMALWCGPQVLLGFPGSRDVDPAMEVGTSPWETSLDAAPVAFRFQLLGARNHGNTNFRNHASILAETHPQAEFFFKEIIIETELELVLPFCPSFIPVFVSGPWKRMMTCQATFVSVVPHPRKEQLHGGVFGPEGGVISPAAYFLGIILLVRG